METKSGTSEFSDFKDFLSWKSGIERDTHSPYVKMQGAYKTKHYTRIICNCHSPGMFRRRGNNLRHLKCQVSVKLDAFCPAGITVTIKNGHCDVECSTVHVGHEQEIGHLFLTAFERQGLSSKIVSKISFQAILDNIRDSVTNSQLERIHLLKKKDLYNIQQANNLNHDSVRHTNDAISVECWVQEMNNDVLFYKPQNVLLKGHPELIQQDFVLVIMTQGQLEMLQNFGDDCICLDETHGLNGYGFEILF